jgi:hypothetical protein
MAFVLLSTPRLFTIELQFPEVVDDGRVSAAQYLDSFLRCAGTSSASVGDNR